MPNLGQASGDAEALIESIRDWTAGFAVPLRAIVIDTLARAIGGGDENTAKDMSILVDNAGKIAEAFHYLVVIVHHAGKTAERGSRGSNALDGAADTMWAVEKGEGQNKASIFAMKDGKDGIEWTFRLNPYEIETGRPQQAPQHTCTVEILSEPAPAQQSATERNTPPLTPSAKILFGIINDAMLDAGEVPEGDLNVPSRMKALKRKTLNTHADSRGYFDPDKPENQNRVKIGRDLDKLVAVGKIGRSKHYVWLIAPRERNMRNIAQHSPDVAQHP